MVSFPSWHCPVTPNHFNRKVIWPNPQWRLAMIYVPGVGALALLLRGAVLLGRVQQFEQGAVVQLKERVPLSDDLVQLGGVEADRGLRLRSGRPARPTRP